MKKNNFLGFTLVEIIITVAILLVLTGIGAMTISQFNSGQKTEAVRNELSAQLKLARNMAVTNQLPSGVSGSLGFVRTSVSSDLTVSTVAFRKNANGTITELGSYPIRKIDGSNAVKVTVSSGFGFLVGDGRLTDANGAISGTSVNIGVSGVDDIKTIIINASGLINEQ